MYCAAALDVAAAPTRNAARLAYSLSLWDIYVGDISARLCLYLADSNMAIVAGVAWRAAPSMPYVMTKLVA